MQVIWDPTTSRFYYAADDVVSSSDNRVAFGFSKTASPSSAADFCKYTIGFGTVFPDYPKLGDSQFFAMIGSNLFSGSNSFLGSDLLAISKPPAGTSCPAASSFKLDDAAPLLINATTQAFTPVPANEIDTKRNGVRGGPARATAGDAAVAVQGHQGRNDRQPGHSKHRNARDGSEVHVALERTAEGVGQRDRHLGRPQTPGGGGGGSRAQRQVRDLDAAHDHRRWPRRRSLV